MKRKQKHLAESSHNKARPSPLYPYDKRTDTISLPPALEKDVLDIALSKGVPMAMKKVMGLLMST